MVNQETPSVTLCSPSLSRKLTKPQEGCVPIPTASMAIPGLVRARHRKWGAQWPGSWPTAAASVTTGRQDVVPTHLPH